MDISFYYIVFFAFALRVVIVLWGSIGVLRIIGFDNLKFLKKYVSISPFINAKAFALFLAFGSFLYFELLISSQAHIMLSEVYAQHPIWTSLLLVSLVLILLSAYRNSKVGIKEAAEVEKDISRARRFKFFGDIAMVGSVFTLFHPVGWVVRGSLFFGGMFVNNKVDGEVSDKVETKSHNMVQMMFFTTLVNLAIVIVAASLIHGQIVLW